MIRLAIGLALLILAALLAAVGWVLARPRWRWDPPTVDEVEPPMTYRADIPWHVPDGYYDDLVRIYSTGSPESVTSRADNGTGLDPRLMGA